MLFRLSLVLSLKISKNLRIIAMFLSIANSKALAMNKKMAITRKPSGIFE